MVITWKDLVDLVGEMSREWIGGRTHLVPILEAMSRDPFTWGEQVMLSRMIAGKADYPTLTTLMTGIFLEGQPCRIWWENRDGLGIWQRTTLIFLWTFMYCIPMEDIPLFLEPSIKFRGVVVTAHWEELITIIQTVCRWRLTIGR